MKNSLLCVLCLLLGSATAYTSPQDSDVFSLDTHNLTFNSPSPFDASTFLKLIEEYTNFTKKPVTNGSEDLAITSLIDRMTHANTQIEIEIKCTKTMNMGAPSKKADERLRNYSDSAKTALKELHKRQNLVRSFAKNSYDLIKETTVAAPARFFGTQKLHASYHYVKNMLPAKSRIQECLLNAPMLTSC